MKIMQICSHYNQGGAAKIVAYIHEDLKRMNQDAYVAYGRGPIWEDPKIKQIDKPAEIYLAAAISFFVGLNGFSNRLATKRLIAYMEEVKPDVVHLHTLHGYYLNFPMLFSYINKNNIPCVWTFHDCHAFVGNCGYFYDCEQWKEGCRSCPYVRRYPKSLFFDFTHYMWKRKKELFTVGNQKIIVTPSEWMTQQAKASFFGKYPCLTIHNGIDTQHTFYPRDKKAMRQKYGYTEEEKLILGIAVGYGDPRKGAQYIMQMAKTLEKEARVILIGWEKQNDAMRKGISNIIPLPKTANTELLADYYSMADVFVLPSLAENYATVSLEAMACGTPVVGFEVGGVTNQLSGNKGLVVPAGDAEAFTNAVRQAIEPDSGLLRGQALADIIRKENSIQQMTDQYLEIYKQVAAIHK